MNAGKKYVHFHFTLPLHSSIALGASDEWHLIHSFVRWIELNVRNRIMQSKTKAQLVSAIGQQGIITIDETQ